MGKKEDDEFTNGCLAVVGAAALVPALVMSAVAVRGYVLMTLWGWLVAPAFHAPALPLGAAAGVALIAGYLGPRFYIKDEYREPAWKAVLVDLAVNPALTLVAGYALHRAVLAGYLTLATP